MRENEQGLALITALMMLLLLSLLAAIMTIWSQRIWFQSEREARSLSGIYALESATARGFWLFFNDINNNLEREQLDSVSYDSEERFVADGRIHYFSASSGQVYELKIVDYFSGIQVELAESEDDFDFIDYSDVDSNELERFRTIRDRFLDYYDSDSSARDESLEESEYTKIGKDYLPRNSVAEYTEEYGWIPGFLELFPPDEYGRMNWFQPNGEAETKPNIFAAPRELVYLLANATTTQRTNIDDAFTAVIENNYTIEFSLNLVDSTLYDTLNEEFSFVESGYYVLLIRPMVDSQLRGRTMEFVIKLNEGSVSTLTNGGIELISFRLI